MFFNTHRFLVDEIVQLLPRSCILASFWTKQLVQWLHELKSTILVNNSPTYIQKTLSVFLGFCSSSPTNHLFLGLRLVNCNAKANLFTQRITFDFVLYTARLASAFVHCWLMKMSFQFRHYNNNWLTISKWVRPDSYLCTTASTRYHYYLMNSNKSNLNFCLISILDPSVPSKSPNI